MDQESIEFDPDVDKVFAKWKTAKVVWLPGAYNQERALLCPQG